MHVMGVGMLGRLGTLPHRVFSVRCLLLPLLQRFE